MAKANTPTTVLTTESKALAVAVATALSNPAAATTAAEAPAISTEPVQEGPTPENTPVPGGGRWRWDINKPGWVDLDKPEPTV